MIKKPQYKVNDIIKFTPKVSPDVYTIAYIVKDITTTYKESYMFMTIFTSLDKYYDEDSWEFSITGNIFDLELVGTKETNPEYFL